MTDNARSIEASGSTLEKAIAAGLEELGIDRDQVEVQVVQEASRGVLGIGSRDAIVRLTEIAAEAELELPGAAESELAQELQEGEPETDTGDEPLSEEEILDLAKDVLATLLAKMQIQAQIQPRVAQPKFEGDSTTLVLDLQGKDLSFLIGRKAETLASIQHLVRLIVNKKIKQRANLMVDVEGYKARRETALKKLALRIADQATRRSKRIALEPMNAYERRIIHITLRNHPTVITESVGDRDHRKVTILPK